MNRSLKIHLRQGRSAVRRGAITVLAAIFSIVILGMVAMSVDVGYILSMKEEMQRTADSAALAACWEYGRSLSEGQDPQASDISARAAAQQYATSNAIGNAAPTLGLNTCNAASGDLVLGYVNDIYNPVVSFDTSSTGFFNAVKVRVRRDSQLNGVAPTFFARVFGHQGQAMYADATAALVRDVRGFQAPSNGGNIDLLPFALDLETWNAWMAESSSVTQDDWTWNAEQKQIVPGSDGWLEVNLYPQGTGSPGNRGTVDIGSSNNSTSDIARQILYGVSPADLSYHGGSIELDGSGELMLNGDTGISAGVKDELAAIQGQPRTIPIFSQVAGPGNNAEYTIVKWMGIRIMDVKLTGPMSKKHVTIQAAPMLGPGVIPSSVPGTSTYVFSPVVLIE
jgi:Flp pilus assembly protein TadG